jgi:hypothetical protein
VKTLAFLLLGLALVLASGCENKPPKPKVAVEARG